MGGCVLVVLVVSEFSATGHSVAMPFLVLLALPPLLLFRATRTAAFLGPERHLGRDALDVGVHLSSFFFRTTHHSFQRPQAVVRSDRSHAPFPHARHFDDKSPCGGAVFHVVGLRTTAIARECASSLGRSVRVMGCWLRRLRCCGCGCQMARRARHVGG